MVRKENKIVAASAVAMNASDYREEGGVARSQVGATTVFLDSSSGAEEAWCGINAARVVRRKEEQVVATKRVGGGGGGEQWTKERQERLQELVKRERLELQERLVTLDGLEEEEDQSWSSVAAHPAERFDEQQAQAERIRLEVSKNSENSIEKTAKRKKEGVEKGVEEVSSVSYGGTGGKQHGDGRNSRSRRSGRTSTRNQQLEKSPSSIELDLELDHTRRSRTSHLPDSPSSNIAAANTSATAAHTTAAVTLGLEKEIKALINDTTTMMKTNASTNPIRGIPRRSEIEDPNDPVLRRTSVSPPTTPSGDMSWMASTNARDRFDVDSPRHPDYQMYVLGFNALLDESHAELEKWYRPRKDIKGSPTSSVTAASPKESRFQVMVKSQEWDSVNAYFHHSEEDEYHKEEDENNKSEK